MFFVHFVDVSSWFALEFDFQSFIVVFRCVHSCGAGLLLGLSDLFVFSWYGGVKFLFSVGLVEGIVCCWVFTRSMYCSFRAICVCCLHGWLNIHMAFSFSCHNQCMSFISLALLLGVELAFSVFLSDVWLSDHLISFMAY